MLTSVELLTILFSHVFAMIYVGYKAIVSKTLDAGLVITLTNSIWQVSMRINTIAGIFNSLSKNNRYIKNYQDFLNMKIDIDKNEISLMQYLEENSISPQRIAVELNEEILPKANYAATVLKDGDVVEIVNFVGGGC